MKFAIEIINHISLIFLFLRKLPIYGFNVKLIIFGVRPNKFISDLHPVTIYYGFVPGIKFPASQVSYGITMSAGINAKLHHCRREGITLFLFFLQYSVQKIISVLHLFFCKCLIHKSRHCRPTSD